jgi:hypothetical protein
VCGGGCPPQSHTSKGTQKHIHAPLELQQAERINFSSHKSISQRSTFLKEMITVCADAFSLYIFGGQKNKNKLH